MPMRPAFVYTTPPTGPAEANDMLLRTTPMVDERPERVPGFRTKYLNGEVPPDRVGANLVHARATRRLRIRQACVCRSLSAAGL